MPTAPLIPKIPPLRTDIQEPQQSSALNRPPAQGVSNGANTASNGASPQHRTSKEWYYYWSKVGEQVVQNTQTLAGLVTYGPHASRPDPSTVPNGAIAVESDRGAIYQNELIQGVPTWTYVAGTMWGTLSPDQRPTDLGAHDAGFDFRTTDEPAREFIWSQAAWVEATPVRYGTHAARLAVDVTKVIEQMLWVETDRGALYQLMLVSGTTPVWQYIAGTMWGTLSPDQRPTDLGTHDAGFEFRGTDQQLEYIWSQAAWIAATPATYWVGGSGGTIYYNSGSVAIGTTTAGAPLTVQGANNADAFHVQGATAGVFLYVKPQSVAGSVEIGYWNGGYYGDISFTGNIGIGVASPTHYLELGSDSAAKPGTSTWTVTSDIRTKRNVHRFEGDIEVIRRLDPIAAEYNGLGGTPEGVRVVSFDAEKLREIVPQCVSAIKRKLRESDAEETEILGVNTHELFFHMLRAIQQLDREIQALKGTPA